MAELHRGAVRFATLGPADSNHALVTSEYLTFHHIEGEAALYRTFVDGVAAVLGGEADFLVQCAAHPDTSRTVSAFYRGLYVVDTFIASSRPLAVLRRRDRAHASTVGAMPATTGYTDLSRWGEVREFDTVSAVADALLAGHIDAGLTFRDTAQRALGALAVEHEVPSPDDAWLVYGRTRVAQGAIVANASAPAAALYRKAAGDG